MDMLLKQLKNNSCALDSILQPVRGKWKAEIVHILKNGPLRLSEINRDLPDAIERVLKRQLRTLEKDGIVVRKTYDGVSPKVEYSLTEQGEWLYCLLCSINQAAEDYLQKNQKSSRAQNKQELA
jgi:Predicted transcriptional regulators